ncbi:MAG: fibronectin type III domain-containing protein [Planctomycetota bacterium]|nr:fibronectin type III domain-containing protein [Planctomycetota bacterium]
MSARLGQALLLLAAIALGNPLAEGGEHVHSAGARRVIELDGPRTLREEGVTYRLTRDVDARYSGFVIAAKDVTLDLGGHTVTYGAAGRESHGIASRHQYHRGTITVRNGRIVQAQGAGAGTHAIDFDGGHDVRLENLQIDVHARDACGIHVYGTPTGSVEIRGCAVACRTTEITNRHYPGVAAIRVADVHVRTEITKNRVTASPQWGIQVTGKGEDTTCRIHENRVTGTKALVANGYMIGVHRRNVRVFDNVLEGESRGIHVDGVDHEGHGAVIHHNRIRAQDQPNAEFDPHWCHGIKLEDTRGTVVHHNVVRVIADAAHSEARALDVDARSGGPLHVYANRFEGLSRAKGKQGKALVWSGLEQGDPEKVVIEHNVFVATDVFVHRTWHSDRGVRFRANAWLVDPALKNGRTPLFERWDNRDLKPSPGHGFLDPYAPRGTIRSSEWAEPGPYTSTRERTIHVAVIRNTKAATDAAVRVLDREGREVFRGRTDEAGALGVPLVVSRLGNGPSVDYRGPFTFVVAPRSGRSAKGTMHLRGPAALRVDVGRGTFARVATRPDAPRRVRVEAAANGRMRITWAAPNEADAIARYLVEVDGQAWLLTQANETELGGLEADRAHEIRVIALGVDGSASAPSQVATSSPTDG